MLVSVLKDYQLGTWLVSDVSTMHISWTVSKIHDLPARTLWMILLVYKDDIMWLRDGIGSGYYGLKVSIGSCTV